MRKALLFISILSFSGLLAAQTDYNKSVGSTAGSFEVNLSGAATYQIPIYAPPGTQGMQPGISLVYSSQAGMGPLGVGWSIAGLSAITRVQKNLYHDDRVAPVSWTNDDHYALDGQILIPISGSNGLNGTEYRTENDGFVKIFSYGNVAGGVPERFEVLTKDGKKIDYGASSDSRYAPPGLLQPLVWSINKITDENGNYMVFEYINLATTSNPLSGGRYRGDFLISKIKYTGNASANLQPYDSIVFKYENCNYYQPYNLEWKILKDTLRLQQITSYAEGAVARNYQPAYVPNSLNTQFFMQSITEFNSAGDSYNSTKFTWEPEKTIGLDYFSSNVATGNLSPFTWSGRGNNCTKFERLVGDINGDGLDDIVSLTIRHTALNTYKSDMHISISTGMGFTDPVSYQHPFEHYDGTPILCDMNGDGKKDLILFSPDSYVYVCLSNGNSFGPCTKWQTELWGTSWAYNPSGYGKNANDGVLHLADVNGDGLPDLIGFRYLAVKVRLNTGSGFTSSGFSDIDNFIKWDAAKTRRMMADINGDGMADIVGFGENEVWVSLSLGDSFTDPKSSIANFGYNQGWRFDNAAQINDIQLVDVNGDGRADIVGFAEGDVLVALSKGNGFEEPVSWSTNFKLADGYGNLNAHPRHFIDVNGDGLSDILVFDWEGCVFHINSGTGFNSGTRITSSWGYKDDWGKLDKTSGINKYPRLFGDFNGDGVFDMIGFGEDGVGVLLGSEHFPRKITQITDGMQNQIAVGYQYYNQAKENTSATETYPFSGKIGPALLVNTVTYNAYKIGETGKESYSFTKPLFHFKGKGFLGFTKIQKNDLFNGGNSTQTFALYNANNCINLLPQRQENVLPNGKKTTIDQSFTTTVNANKRLVVKLTGEVIKSELDNVQTSKDYQYDANLNLTEAYTKVYPLNTSNLYYSEKVNTTYENRGTWNFKPTRITATKSKDTETIVNTTSFAYTGVRPASKTTEPDQANYKVVESYSVYDNYGNPVAVSISANGLTSRNTQYIYDSKGRFVTKVTNPAGQVEEYTYEPKYGNVLKYKDINNFETNNTYNSWGQLIKTSYPDGDTAGIQTKWVGSTVYGEQVLYYVHEAFRNRQPVTTYYDALGREAQTTTNLDVTVYTQSLYDGKGRLWKKSLPCRIGTADAQKEWTTYTYDNLGRMSEEWGPLLHKSYTYGTGTVTEKDFINNQASTTKTYDILGNLVKVADQGGEIVYTYNAHLLPARITSNNQATTMAYDLMGRRTAITEPNAGCIKSRYNAFGELIAQTDAKNDSTTYTYDGLGRKKTAYINSNSLAEGSAVYTYDAGNKANGKLSSVTSPKHNTTYTYNDKGYLASQREVIQGSGDYTTSYTYDNLNRVSKITYPQSFSIDYAYIDKSSICNRVSNANITIYGLSEINALAQPIKESYDGGWFTQRQYNAAGLLTSLKTYRGNTTDTIQNLAYRYNDAGLMTQRKCLRTNNVQDFGYDNLKRLTNYGENTIAYAENGNITKKTGIASYTYSGTKPNAVTKVVYPSTIPPYKSINNLATAYTPFNKVKSIAELDANGKVKQADTIEYGNDLQRIRSKGNGKTFVYVNGLYEEEIDPKTGKVRMLHYIKANGKTVAIMVRETAQYDKRYNIHTDHLGSYDVIVDQQTNTVAERLSFDAWGNRQNPANWKEREAEGAAHLFRRGFTGHEHLDQYGVINMNGRLYDPAIGRFFSPDPFVADATFTQDFNRYTYARNNPLMYTDPSGEWIHLVIGAALGGAMNWAVNGFQFNVKGLGYFGVGALAGALGAGIGAGVNSMFMAGGSFGAGFLGTSTVGVATGFLAGGTSAAAGGFASGFIGGFGNGLLGNQNIGQSLWSGTKAGLIGGASGFIIGGITGGIAARADGRNFWDGSSYTDKSIASMRGINDIKISRQSLGSQDCALKCAEMGDAALGGKRTFEQIVNAFKETNGLTTPDGGISDGAFWHWFAEKGGYSYSWGEGMISFSEATNLLNNNYIVPLSSESHSVLLHSVVERTVVYQSGKTSVYQYFKIIDPAYGVIKNQYKILNFFRIK